MRASEDGEKTPAIFANDDGHGRGRTAGRKPITPADDETSILTDSAARKIVLASAAWNRGAEFRHRGGAEERVKSANDPHTEKQPSVWKASCDVTGRSNDARGNRVADGGGNSKPHAENLQQPAAALCDSGYSERGSLWCVRQCAISGEHSKLRHEKKEHRRFPQIAGQINRVSSRPYSPRPEISFAAWERSQNHAKWVSRDSSGPASLDNARRSGKGQNTAPHPCA